MTSRTWLARLERQMQPSETDREEAVRRARVREAFDGGLRRVKHPRRREIMSAFDAAPAGRVSDIVGALREGRRRAGAWRLRKAGSAESLTALESGCE